MPQAKYQFEPQPIPGGRIEVFRDFEPGMSYSLGLDCALGISGKDFDAAQLFDLQRRQCAVIHGHWGQEIIPHIENVIAGFGGKARVFVVGEAAKEGVPVLRHLYDHGYWLYYARADQAKARQTRDMLGHVPVQWDLPVRLLQKLVRERSVTIHDDETLRQIAKFGFRPKSASMSPDEAIRDQQLTWGAPSGDHDDLVRAAALAMYGIEYLPQFEPPKEKYAPDSIAAFLGYDKPDEDEDANKSPWS